MDPIVVASTPLIGRGVNCWSLILATILGLAIWGEVPISELLLGSPIVVASGLYIL